MTRDRLVIEDLDRLKVVADPLRLRLINLLVRPRTAKGMAEILGVPTTRLYYHLQQLEQHGFIEVVRRRKVSGIEERTYQAVAESVGLSPELAAASLQSSGLLRAFFDLVHAEASMALEARPGSHIGDAGSGLPILSLTRLALTPERFAEFSNRLEALITEYSCPGAPPPGATAHHLVLAAYPLPEEGDDDAAPD